MWIRQNIPIRIHKSATLGDHTLSATVTGITELGLTTEEETAAHLLLIHLVYSIRGVDPTKICGSGSFTLLL